ncbi:hypothetical protein DRO26_02650 [Candidatus Bathyarchaeota archaeon]|nr:MAG: hypothetical protein DRO26_02650 [Candidatus Bathyarchaeota archaeon]
MTVWIILSAIIISPLYNWHGIHLSAWAVIWELITVVIVSPITHKTRVPKSKVKEVKEIPWH